MRERHQLGVRVRLDLAASAASSAPPPSSPVDAPLAAVPCAAVRGHPRPSMVPRASAALRWRRRRHGQRVRAHLRRLQAAAAAAAAAPTAPAPTVNAPRSACSLAATASSTATSSFAAAAR